MKKLICYLGIIVLFGLAIFPPILRIALPDKKEEKKEVITKSLLLACTGTKYITTTNYEGEKINMIMIKQIKTDLEEENDNKDEFGEYFNSFRNMGDVLYNKVDDGEILTIDFSVTEHSSLNLSKIKNPIETQKQIYEQLGLTCTVRE